MEENTNIIEITSKEQFDEIIKSDKLTIVDFWAEWCGPCRMLKPILHKIAEEDLDIQLLTINVDLDTNRDLATQYNVISIPRVIFFKNWKDIEDFVWVLPENEILRRIEVNKWAKIESEDLWENSD